LTESIIMNYRLSLIHKTGARPKHSTQSQDTYTSDKILYVPQTTFY